jgi:hypothetical protein
MSCGPLLTILAFVLLLQMALQQPLSKTEHSALMNVYQQMGKLDFFFHFHSHAHHTELSFRMPNQQMPSI